MAANANKTSDRIALFLIFSIAAAVIITSVFVFGFGAELTSILHVAGLGGLSVGCIALFFSIAFDPKAPAVPPVAVDRVLPQARFGDNVSGRTRPAEDRQASAAPVKRETRGGLKVSPDKRDHVVSFSSEMERAGRSVTAG